MSRPAGKAYHPVNGATEPIWEGFSWPCLFLGCFWYLFKGLWGWAVISFVLAVMTLGLSWFVLPFFANGQHAKAVLQRGYLTEKQWLARAAGAPGGPGAGSIADELAKLAALKAQGHLSEAEFEDQKRHLLRR